MNSEVTPTIQCFFRLLVFAVLFFAQGCTSVTDPFTGKVHEEITPFAEKTVDVLVARDFRLRDNELLHLRPYVDDSFVELDELQQHLGYVMSYRDKLVEYSIDLVRLTEQYRKESERVAAYASHLEQMIEITDLNRLGISEADWSEILETIRGQETFLNALRSFQPVITAAGSDFDDLVTKIETDLLVATRKEFDRRIESNFMEVNELLSILQQKRKQLLAAMIALEKYRAGNRAAISDFRQYHADQNGIFSSDTPNAAQLAALENELRDRISYSTQLIAEMSSDHEKYVETRAELDRKEIEILKALAIARLQVETWSRAHHALASGVKKPGELMQLTVNAARHYLFP